MTAEQKKTLRAQYPNKLTLENVRCILHISKRKTAWLLANGYIKCRNNGKKTRQYSIDINDLFAYMEKAENTYLPVGAFLSRQTVNPIFNMRPPENFKEWLIKFFVEHSYCIIRKSDVHMRLLQKFYNQ